MKPDDRFARSIRELEAASQDLANALKALSESLGRLKVEATKQFIDHSGTHFVNEDERALAVWLEHEPWVTLN